MNNQRSTFYVYKCDECGFRGEERLTGDDHDGEVSACETCGAAVTLEWDGGVTFEVAQSVSAQALAKARGEAQ